MSFNQTASVWKLLRVEEACMLLSAGFFAGSPDDLRDGFVHLSAEDQLLGTLAKHFAGEAGLVAARCDPARMGEGLRWEPSRGGALFPHLFRALTLADVDLLVPLAEERLPQLVGGGSGRA
ncbi:MAG: DUF952 domain-containing protein [Acuticoccus sp.]